jgi:hypothetical protein
MAFLDQAVPALSDTLVPPIVRGTADLTDFAYQGNDYDALMERIDRSPACNPPAADDAARTYDAAIAAQLAFRRAEGLNLQDAALVASQLFRNFGAPQGALRLLALVGPGDLMTNTPLDFLTNHLNVRLDLLYVLPDRPLPPVIPDHDVAFFALGEGDPATQMRHRRLFAMWPRPALNDPICLPAMARDALPRSLAGIEGVFSPKALAVSRSELEAFVDTSRPIAGMPPWPCPWLVRPVASHAGIGLARVQTAAELAKYLGTRLDQDFFVTEFEDYCSPDGFYRKSRIAFIDRRPFLCHMAISRHWMVHYLNADMTGSAAKRAQEEDAMATFDDGFARRHAASFDALYDRLGSDYYSIDCAETRDGRLLVFEADPAAIIHLMDPPDLFPYKQPQMRKVFAAFEAMLRRRAAQPAHQREAIRSDVAHAG